MKKKRLGEVLRERGNVSAENLTRALQEQQGKLVHLGELLLQGGSVSKKDLIAALGEVTSVPYFDCSKVQVPADVLETIPAGMAWRFNVLPIKLANKNLTVVLEEPQNLQIIDELRFKTGKTIVPQLGFHGEIRGAIEKHYGPDKSSAAAGVRSAGLVKDVKEMEFISSTDQQRNIDAMREMQAELLQKSKTTPAVMLVASMIKAAAQRRASDIHIEPQSEETSIRLRVDGILREFERIPRALQNSVASRVKILSDMDIAERRAPQDGRFLVKIGDRRLDLRVSTLPTQYGEKVVMRLLESDAPTQDFEKLGFPAVIATEMKRMLAFAARNDSGNRADGLREKHHVVRVAESRTETIDQYHHGGRSGGIRDTGIEPSAGKREGGSDVRDEPAVDSAARSGRNHDRRNPR